MNPQLHANRALSRESGKQPASPLRRWVLGFAVVLLTLTPAWGQSPGSPAGRAPGMLPPPVGPATAPGSTPIESPAYTPPAAPQPPEWARPAAPLGGLLESPEEWKKPEKLSSALQIMLLLTVLSMAPAILLMTTSFVRIVVVLGMLRQALGLQQLPPSQVITALAMFMTLLIMTPVWTDVYTNAIDPYTSNKIDFEEAGQRASGPIKMFMARQIEAAGNRDDVWLFFRYMPKGTEVPRNYSEVPLQVLLPAYMLSELKTAFLIGFQVYLPFLILDIVISSVTISMNMMMLPPAMISLPFKIMLFVLVDGWHLIVGMLLESFAPYT